MPRIVSIELNILLIPLCCAISAINAAPPSTADSKFDEILDREMAALNTAAGFETHLKKTSSDGIRSTPQFNIYFSRELFQQICTQSNVRQIQGVIRFLLAHEQAHQVQFRTYGANNVNRADPDVSRIKECQADILGAKYLGRSWDEPGGDEQADQNFNDALRDLLEVTFNLGSEEKDADHPNRQARRTAARLGASRAQFEKMEKFAASNQMAASDPKYALSLRHLTVVLDIRQGESELEWSLRQARRIVHFQSAAYKSLAIEKEDVSTGDTTQDSGISTFDVTYVNNAEQPIKVDMEIQSVTAAEDDPADTSRWQKWSVRNYTFRLEPHETYRARGELGWQKIEESVYPRIIIPVKNDEALATCFFDDR